MTTIAAAIGPEADLVAMEAAVWIANLKRVASAYWGGMIRDVLAGQDVDISMLPDNEINDRDRFPLFGYVGQMLNTKDSYTKRWATPQEVTVVGSPYFGSYWMRMPEVGNPYNAATTALLLAAWNNLIITHPNVQVVDEVDTDLLFEPEEVA